MIQSLFISVIIRNLLLIIKINAKFTWVMNNFASFKMKISVLQIYANLCFLVQCRNIYTNLHILSLLKKVCLVQLKTDIHTFKKNIIWKHKDILNSHLRNMFNVRV